MHALVTGPERGLLLGESGEHPGVHIPTKRPGLSKIRYPKLTRKEEKPVQLFSPPQVPLLSCRPEGMIGTQHSEILQDGRPRGLSAGAFGFPCGEWATCLWPPMLSGGHLHGEGQTVSWNRLVGVDRAPYTMACTFPLGTRTQHIGDDICNLRTPTSSWATQVGRANGNASLFRHVWQA